MLLSSAPSERDRESIRELTPVVNPSCCGEERKKTALLSGILLLFLKMLYYFHMMKKTQQKNIFFLIRMSSLLALAVLFFLLAHGVPSGLYDWTTRYILQTADLNDVFDILPFVKLMGWYLAITIGFFYLSLLIPAHREAVGERIFWGTFQKFMYLVYAVIIGLPVLVLFDSFFIQIPAVFIGFLEPLAWPDELPDNWFINYFEFLVLSGLMLVYAVIPGQTDTNKA